MEKGLKYFNVSRDDTRKGSESTYWLIFTLNYKNYKKVKACRRTEWKLMMINMKKCTTVIIIFRKQNLLYYTMVRGQINYPYKYFKGPAHKIRQNMVGSWKLFPDENCKEIERICLVPYEKMIFLWQSVFSLYMLKCTITHTHTCGWLSQKKYPLLLIHGVWAILYMLRS